MNIDNEPGRRRCKNHKATLLGEIRIIGGGTLRHICTFGNYGKLEILGKQSNSARLTGIYYGVLLAFQG